MPPPVAVRAGGAPGVWAAFAVVHVALAVLGVLVVPAQAFWDVDLYRWWAWTFTAGDGRPLLDEPWVYPAGALVPVLAAGVLSTVSFPLYATAWCAVVTLLDGVVVAGLLRRGAPAAAAWWLGALLALGPVALGRLDAVAAALLAAGLLAASEPGRRRAASALLTAGAWVKVAPGVLLLPLAAAARRPWREVVGPAAAVTAAVALVVVVAGGGANLASFLGAQGDRGLQAESVTATPWVLAGALAGEPAPRLNEELITYEVPSAAAAADALDVVLPLGVLAVGVLLVVARRRGTAEDALVPAALVLVLWLVVANKVGSPQFVTWPVAAVAAALAGATGTARASLPGGFRAFAATTLAVAGLTQVLFPWGYVAFLTGDVAVTLVLAVRNALLVALLVPAAVALVRTALRTRR